MICHLTRSNEHFDRSGSGLLKHETLVDVSVGSMSLKKSEMRVAELSIGAFLASFSLDRRP